MIKVKANYNIANIGLSKGKIGYIDEKLAKELSELKLDYATDFLVTIIEEPKEEIKKISKKEVKEETL